MKINNNRLAITLLRVPFENKGYRNPFLLFCLYASLLFSFQLFSFSASAQAKFGHIDYNSIISNMPGIDSIQTLIVEYHSELQAIQDQIAKEFNEKQTAFEQLTNNSNTSQAVLKIKQDELLAMYKRMQEFENSMDTDFRAKQMELIEPFQLKLIEAIKKIAKANNYNYVFDISSLLFYAASDDLTDKVKAELGIK